MFGTVFSMRPKPGEERAIVELVERWQRERGPSVAGALGSYLFKSRERPGELIGVAIFDSVESYRKNAEDPAQDRWYRELRAKLGADPEWQDGDVLVAWHT